MYDPAIWRDYFVMVGGGAAALTGIGMMASFVFMVTGAWLLLVGVESTQAQERDRVSVALGPSNPGQ